MAVKLIYSGSEINILLRTIDNSKEEILELKQEPVRKLRTDLDTTIKALKEIGTSTTILEEEVKSLGHKTTIVVVSE